MGFIRETLSKIRQKVRDLRSRETKYFRNPETFMPKAYNVQEVPEALEEKPRKQERFFYRNAGFNRAEKNNIAGQIRQLKKRRTQANKLQIAFLAKMLEASPANIPHVRGRAIPARHAAAVSA